MNNDSQILEQEWTTEAGLLARVVIQPAGHRCGYVKVPVGHPCHGLDYDDMDIDVHGGVTYAEQQEEGFWIGFDCAHYGDAPDPKYMPESFRASYHERGVVRTLEYCAQECESMAKQLMEKK